MNILKMMLKTAVVPALAVLLLAGYVHAAEDIMVRGIVFESERGMLMETEEGDILRLIGEDLELYVESIVYATGTITVMDSGEEVLMVTSIEPDGEAPAGTTETDVLN